MLNTSCFFQAGLEPTPQSEVDFNDYVHTTGNRISAETWKWSKYYLENKVGLALKVENTIKENLGVFVVCCCFFVKVRQKSFEANIIWNEASLKSLFHWVADHHNVIAQPRQYTFTWSVFLNWVFFWVCVRQYASFFLVSSELETDCSSISWKSVTKINTKL